MKTAIYLSQENSINALQDGSDLDWKLIANNVPMIDVVILRASEGTAKVDSAFQKYVVGAISKGIEFGFYHVAAWNTNQDGTEEARHFLSTIKSVPYPTHKLFLDVESNKNNIIISPLELQVYVQSFFKEVEAQGYTNYGLRGPTTQGVVDGIRTRVDLAEFSA